MKKETKKLLWIGLIAIVLIGGGAWVYTASQQPALAIAPKADPKLLSNPQSHSTEVGTRTYPATIVEFGDYECPACGYAEPIVEKILATDPRVQLIFRNFPLSQHPFAMIAAEAAEAAGAQGKFWEMHNAIYANQNIWTTMQTPMDAFIEMAKKLNLNINQFTQDVNSNKYASIINKDQQDGTALGVDSTPTFFINGVEYSAGLDYNTMELAITQIIQEDSTQQQTQQSS